MNFLLQRAPLSPTFIIAQGHSGSHDIGMTVLPPGQEDA